MADLRLSCRGCVYHDETGYPRVYDDGTGYPRR